jgi:hypothetical protein
MIGLGISTLLACDFLYVRRSDEHAKKNHTNPYKNLMVKIPQNNNPVRGTGWWVSFTNLKSKF